MHVCGIRAYTGSPVYITYNGTEQIKVQNNHSIAVELLLKDLQVSTWALPGLGSFAIYHQYNWLLLGINMYTLGTCEIECSHIGDRKKWFWLCYQ